MFFLTFRVSYAMPGMESLGVLDNTFSLLPYPHEFAIMGSVSRDNTPPKDTRPKKQLF